MKSWYKFNKSTLFYIAIFNVLIFVSCQKKSSPADVWVSDIGCTETFKSVYLDLPGVFFPDNPDFDISDSNTWTGNAAQYVKTNYIYKITYQITNSGGSIAYDTEVDIFHSYDNGSTAVDVRHMGDVSPNQVLSGSMQVMTTNKVLTECGAEVYWFD